MTFYDWIAVAIVGLVVGFVIEYVRGTGSWSREDEDPYALEIITT